MSACRESKYGNDGSQMHRTRCNQNGVVQPLLTDLYQITMAYAYWKSGKINDTSVFDLFFRNNPFQGEFTIFAGLEEGLKFLENFHYTDSDIDYLKQTLPEGVEDDFFEYLRNLTTDDVTLYAIDEGSVAFPRVPLIKVEGPLIVVQLLETTLLTLVNYASLMATNAARYRMVAGKQVKLLEFGLRRAQGPDGGLSASKYSYVGGFDGTSNVLAGKLFNIPVNGTHAHAYITSFTGLAELKTTMLKHKTTGIPQDLLQFSVTYRDSLSHVLDISTEESSDGELAAMVSYAIAFPDGFMALVDTYDVKRIFEKQSVCNSQLKNTNGTESKSNLNSNLNGKLTDFNDNEVSLINDSLKLSLDNVKSANGIQNGISRTTSHNGLLNNGNDKRYYLNSLITNGDSCAKSSCAPSTQTRRFFKDSEKFHSDSTHSDSFSGCGGVDRHRVNEEKNIAGTLNGMSQNTSNGREYSSRNQFNLLPKYTGGKSFRSGLLNFCAVALALNDLGYRAVGIRIDSGDLAYLSCLARETFEKVAHRFNIPWFNTLTIVASNDINEETILSLNEQGHKIDCFGIGTHLVTCQRQPALGCVYKLVEINDQARIKLSQDVEKVTMPGHKNAYRLYSADGHALIDLLQKVKESPPEVGHKVLCRHPFQESKRAYVIPSRVEPLYKVFWKNGRIQQTLPSLEQIRGKVQSSLRTIRNDHKRTLNPTPYKVAVSDNLYNFIHDLWLQNAPIGELS